MSEGWIGRHNSLAHCPNFWVVERPSTSATKTTTSAQPEFSVLLGSCFVILLSVFLSNSFFWDLPASSLSFREFPSSF